MSRHVLRAHRFCLEVDAGRAKGLVVAAGGREDVMPNYVIERDGFPYYVLEFVVAGRGRLWLGDRQQELRPGMVFTYGPKLYQHITTHQVDRLTKYFVCFTGPSAERILRSYALPPGTIAEAGSTAELRIAFEQLIEFASHRSDEAQQLCSLQVNIILSLASQQPAPGSNVQYGRAWQSYERCRTIALERCLDLHSARELAAASHVEPAYLCRLFRRFAGTSPYQYLFGLKMAWAATELRSGNLLVRHVADRLGIDPFQFSRGFKRVYGMSPTDFQKVHAAGRVSEGALQTSGPMNRENVLR